MDCPICGEPVNVLMASYNIVEDGKGGRWPAHVDCSKDLPREEAK